jgi:2-polyprenyl-6-methoxyphenol hydroxylase-like FAD-dependent oxidoreductase
MVELREETPDRPHPNPWVLGQSHTEAILRARLADLGVRVELSTELVDFVQDGTGVDAVLRRGGGTETVRTRYLVGADGGSSFVRKHLRIAFPGTTDESLRSLLADVSVDGLDHDYGHWFSYDAERKAGIMLTPLPGGDQFQVGVATGHTEAVPTLQGLQAVLHHCAHRTDLRLRNLTWLTEWRPNTRLAERFRVGRVLIAGDAAHVHPPTGGQGMNTGVQDAYNLGWKLAAALSGTDLLDSYEEERRAVAASVLGLSSKLLQRHVDGAPDAFDRNGADQLGLGYRDSPLAVDDRAEPGPLRAGDRAPDAPVYAADATRTTLFDLFRGTHATLLVFGAGGSAYTDTEGHAYAAYDPGAGARFLIRPDGYVGRISATP